MRDASLPEMVAEASRLSALLDAGLKALREAGQEYAEAEQQYRLEQARVMLAATGTVAERQAQADLASSDARLRRDLADAQRTAALEAVRSRRGQLSALQSILAAHRAEAEYDRTSGR